MMNSVYEILDNAELLISLCVIFEVWLFIIDQKKSYHSPLTLALLSLVGILVINAPWVVVPGVHMDARVVFIGLIFLIIDLPSAMMVTMILIVYRMFLGGVGSAAGITMMAGTGLIATLWKTAGIDQKIKNSWISLYLFGLILHGMVMVSFLLLPKDIQASVYEKTLVPVLVLYPLVTVLVGKVLLMQKSRITDHLRAVKAEKKFRSIFERANVGISFVDTNGLILDANERFCQIIGYPKAELVGLSFKDITHEDDLKTDEQHLTDLLRGKSKGYSMDKRYITKEGNTVWINLTVSLFQEEEGHEILMGSIIDITQRKMAEIDLVYQTYHDPLTGLHNRRYFEEHKPDYDAPALYPLSITLISINGLPLFNEVFGFSVGDKVMMKGAQILKDQSTATTQLYRMDGDKFMILQPNQSPAEVNKQIRTIREAFAKESVENIVLSISAGHASKNKAHVEIEKILTIASDNLKRDKLTDKSSMASKTVDIIMNSLYEKNKREMMHSRRVSAYCEQMAIKLNLDENDIDKIRIAGLLHDIGKIGISDSILDKSGKLTELEWLEIQRHTEAGYRILSSADEFSEIAESILCHHEHYDGSGYPKGLKGEAIPLFSRIISLADAFDAMMSDRAYRKALTLDKAIKEIKTNAGHQFDPQLIEPFIQVIEEFNPSLGELQDKTELLFNES